MFPIVGDKSFKGYVCPFCTTSIYCPVAVHTCPFCPSKYFLLDTPTASQLATVAIAT